VPFRRLDDQIRDLCARVCAAPAEEQGPILSQLQSAIHKKIERLRKLAANNLLHGKNHKERRAGSNSKTI
jgi:hypothetical protein